MPSKTSREEAGDTQKRRDNGEKNSEEMMEKTIEQRTLKR